MYCRRKDANGGTERKKLILMSLLDTFRTYNPVTLAVGSFFVLCGVSSITELVLHGVRIAIGGVFVVVLFVLIPVSLGIAIVDKQLRLRKNSK